MAGCCNSSCHSEGGHQRDRQRTLFQAGPLQVLASASCHCCRCSPGRWAKNRSSPSRSCPPAPAPPGEVLPPKLACLFLLPQELKPWLCCPLRAPWMVGPRTAAPRAPRPRPTIPPSKAWLPVKEGVSPPKKNFSSTSPEVGLFVFLLAELPFLLEEEDTPPLN